MAAACGVSSSSCISSASPLSNFLLESYVMATLPSWFNEARFLNMLDLWRARMAERMGENRPGRPDDDHDHSDHTYTLAEALAAEDLPDTYYLSDASLTLEPGTIEAVGEQIDAAQAILDGAENADELELDADYTIEDSADAILAAAEAGNPLVEDISLITVTDETITEEQRDALVELGFNADDLPPIDDGGNGNEELAEALANWAAAVEARDAFIEETGDVEAELAAAQGALAENMALGTDRQLAARLELAEADLEAAQDAAVD